MKSKEPSRINVRNDQEMIANGLIRCLPVEPRDPNVWTKSEHDRRLLYKYKYKLKHDMHFHTMPFKSSTVVDKLIIYLKPNKEYPKSVISIKCSLSSIPEIISKYYVMDKKSGKVVSLIHNYKFNGKTYKAGELPYFS